MLSIASDRGAGVQKMETKSGSQHVARLLCIVPLLLVPASPAAADGAFTVDNSDIGQPGECNIDSWMSAASNHDFAAATAPACVVKLGIPLELGGQLQRSRSDGVWGTSGTLTAKANIIPMDQHPFGLGISGGGSWDLVTGTNTGGYINVPVTFKLRENFRINVNGGWLYDNVAKIHYATWGAGFEWEFFKPLTLIGEVYGQAGRLPAVEEGEAPAPNSIREPRTQLGLRFALHDKADIDVIWGHNITGENAHWGTIGLNVRF